MKGLNVARLEAELSLKHLEVALITSPANLAYVSGVTLADEDRLKWNAGVRNVAVVTRTGDATLIVADSSEHQAKRDTWIDDVRIYPWRVSHTLPELIVDVLREKGKGSSHIGVELPYLPVPLHRVLEERLPSVRFEDCSEALTRARAIKTTDEIRIMRQAVMATGRALAGALDALGAGSTEREIAHEFTTRVQREGAERIEHVWMYGGDRTTDKFRMPGDTRLKDGDLFRVDVGAIFGGYNSDIARMGIVGAPSEQQRKIYQGLWEAQQRMIECVQPGVAVGRLVQVLHEECQRHSLAAPRRGLFAHGLGMVVHDYPIVQEATDMALIEEGMILAIEPYLVVGGEKYAIEDDVLVTATGAEVLSAALERREMWPMGERRGTVRA